MKTYAGLIALAADCGLVSAALEMEHETLDALLQSLNEAVVIGAPMERVGKVLEATLQFFTSHSAREEDFLRKQGVRIEAHAAAHAMLRERMRGAMDLLQAERPDAPLDVIDVLHLLHEHARMFDRSAYAQVQGETQARLDWKLSTGGPAGADEWVGDWVPVDGGQGTKGRWDA